MNWKIVFLCSQQDNRLKILVLLKYKRNFQVSIASTEGLETLVWLDLSTPSPVWNGFHLRLSPLGRRSKMWYRKEEGESPTCIFHQTVERGDSTSSEKKRTSIGERHFPKKSLSLKAFSFLLCYLLLAKKLISIQT